MDVEHLLYGAIADLASVRGKLDRQIAAIKRALAASGARPKPARRKRVRRARTSALTCHWCDRGFAGKVAELNRARHESSAHPKQYQAAKSQRELTPVRLSA